MFKKFYPDTIFEKFKHITPEFLKSKNISAVILDIDNTLVNYDMVEPDDEVISWIDSLKANNIKVCILSNAKIGRVEKFNQKLNVLAIHKAGKPSKKGFLRALQLLKSNPYQTAMVGDQIFTDIYGAKRISIFTILVTPISKNEIWPIKVKRVFEKIILRKYKKKYKNKIR